MRLVREILAAVVGVMRLPNEGTPETQAEEKAWAEYHSGWEMDPPPDPRSVYLAGYRAGREERR